MKLYKYRGADKDGNAVEGTIEEDSQRNAVLALETQGIRATIVEEEPPAQRVVPRKSRLSWSDLAQFNEQLATITSGGLPLSPSIAIMAKEVKSTRLRSAFDHLRRDLESGKSLDEAFVSQPTAFPPMYVTLVRAGERAGNLPEVFSHLSAYSKRMLEIKNMVQEILTYPIVVILAAFGLVTFLMIKVVPVYAAIFSDFGGQLPAPTRLLVNLSDLYIRNVGILAVIVCALILLGVVLLPSLFRGESGGYARDWLKMRIPLVGRLFRNGSKARFCHALAMLLNARVPVLESLELAAAAGGNEVMRRAIAVATVKIGGGMPIAEAFSSTGFFDAGFCWLLKNAEQRGDVPNALQVLEKDYERTLENLRTSLLFLAGPVVIVSIGCVLGFIIISLYLPIFSLGDVISGNSR
jgi:type IV pilus assembly protein PilC